MKKYTLFVFLILFVLGINKEILASGIGTKFQIYVPPNAYSSSRYVQIYITATSDSTYITLTDDNADGDNDDSFTGMLRHGETYLRFIKDGTVNDDQGGKEDGDYFIITASKPVIVGQYTKAENSHDFIPSINNTMKGNFFKIFTPVSTNKLDINAFVYQDNTTIYLYDISANTQTSTGIARVNFNNPSLVFSITLNTKQDLINVSSSIGRNKLVNGKSYLLYANKPVTVQIGSLNGATRDGGSFVPGTNGSTLDNFYYFGIPAEKSNEQELRIVSFNNGVTVQVDRLSSGNWISLANYNLNQYQNANYISSTQYQLFRATVTGGKVTIFEGNDLETGSDGKSDMYNFAPSNKGDQASTYFNVWLPYPGDQRSCRDPFTGSNFTALWSHIFVYSAYNTTVTFKDVPTNGGIIDTSFTVDAGRYKDFKVNTTKYASLTSGSRQPYIAITSTQPIVASVTNWYDSWMSYATEVIPNSVTMGSDFNVDSVYSGSNAILSGYAFNDGYTFSTRKLTISIPDGFNYVTSNLNTPSQGNLGQGTVANLGGGEKSVTWQGFNFNLFDSVKFSLTVTANSLYANGSAIQSGTTFEFPSAFSGISGTDTINSQTASGIKIKNSNSYAEITKYIVAFEDLKNSAWNDWEVNDWVASVIQSVEADSLDRIKRIVFNYEALARGSSFNHTFYQKVNILGNSTVSLTVYDTLGNVKSDLSFSNQARSGAFTTTIFPSTKQALPPATGQFSTNTYSGQNWIVKGYTAKLEIVLNNTLNTLSSIVASTFDPYIITEFGNEIHIASIAGLAGNTQNVDNNVVMNTPLYGYFLDLGYKLPYDWRWPLEGPAYPIWVAYPEFEGYIISGQFLNQDWYDYPDSTKVWNKRIVEDDNLQYVSAFNTKSDMIENRFDESSLSTSVFIDTLDKFFSSPKLVDLDNNGTLEALVGCVDSRFYAFNSNGEIMPGFPVPTAGIIRSTAAVDTTYAPGIKAIIFGSDDGKLYGVTQTGKPLPGFPVNTDGAIKSSPAIVDLRNDGNKYIVAYSGNGKLFVFDMQGRTQPGFPRQLQKTFDTFGSLLILPSPATADLFNDGSREIIVSTIDSSLFVISNTGSDLSGFPLKLDNIIYASPVVSKFRDNSNKIIIVSSGGYVYVINRNGSIFQQRKIAESFISSPVVFDINRDGTKDIIVVSTDGTVFSLNAETLEIQWEVSTATILSTPVIADVSGDEFPEVIVPTMTGVTFVFESDGAIDSRNTNLIDIFDSWIISGPAIGDVDNNGKLDIVLASFDKTIRTYEFPNSNPESKIHWGSFGYNLGNTRWDESDYIPPDQPDALGQIFNYPNPVTTERTTIRAELPLNVEEIDLKIFDIGGELVKELSKKDFIRNGIYWDYTWDLQNGKNVPVANGVYLFFIEAKLNGNTYKKNQKMGVAR